MHPTILPASRVLTVAAACARGALLVGLVFTVDHAFAAGKVYRCGNAYQDQPCAAAPADAPKSADKPAVREAPPSTADRKAPATGTADRLVVDPPRAMVIEARR